MKKIFSVFFNTPWYPIAISAYPALALLNANAGEVQSNAVVRPLLVSILFGGILYFITWLYFRNIHKAAFLTALWLALFFSFGHVYIYIDAKYPKSNYTTWLAVGWIILFVLAAVWASRPKLTFVSSASILNMVALALLVMSVGQISFEVSPRSAQALGADHAPVESDLTCASKSA